MKANVQAKWLDPRIRTSVKSNISIEFFFPDSFITIFFICMRIFIILIREQVTRLWYILESNQTFVYCGWQLVEIYFRNRKDVNIYILNCNNEAFSWIFQWKINNFLRYFHVILIKKFIIPRVSLSIYSSLCLLLMCVYRW